MGKKYLNVLRPIGASSIAKEPRQIEDFYATDPLAVRLLIEVEQFAKYIWEPACGEGHISEELKKNLRKHFVFSSDIIDRGYGDDVFDFFDVDKPAFTWDIITNPPYSRAQEFVEHALEISREGSKIAMLLRIQFLEGQKRRELFDREPPKTVYVFSRRIRCAKNGDFERYKNTTMCFAWFVWVKGWRGDTVIKWIN